LICLLFLFAALFIFCNKRRLVVFLVAVSVFWLLGSWLSGPMIRLAQVGYGTPHGLRLAPRTAIIVLGGGTEYDRADRLVPYGDSATRVETAAAIYRHCEDTGRACQIIISGGNPQHHEESEAKVYGRMLREAGVRDSDLIMENESLNTYENARNTYEILKSREYDTTALVTSSLHMRRAMLAFNAFGLHPQPVVAFVRKPKSWPVPHLKGWIDSNSALHELVGVARFYVWRWLGLY
jgi:uncharacterized SAM-binding protein YcdF (DUF218 family)